MWIRCKNEVDFQTLLEFDWTHCFGNESTIPIIACTGVLRDSDESVKTNVIIKGMPKDLDDDDIVTIMLDNGFNVISLHRFKFYRTGEYTGTIKVRLADSVERRKILEMGSIVCEALSSTYTVEDFVSIPIKNKV